MRISITVFIFILAIVKSSSLAGEGTFDGETESSWKRGHYSVIVATIDSVEEPDPKRPGELTVTLSPQATLGGSFDCSVEPKITPTCYFGHSALEFRPEKGMIVIVLIANYESDPGLRIPNRGCPLLPNKQPMCVIKGLGDPEVAKTLARIQKARAIAIRDDPERH